MRVIVYVEGPSDALAMRSLLDPLIASKTQEGIHIDFFPAPAGNKKKSVLLRVPQKAVNILRNDANAVVAALPDLYPRNVGFPHESFEELRDGIVQRFKEALRRKGIRDARIEERFKVFCFKHDLEALVLSAESALKERLGSDAFAVSWRRPVEDQNHDKPPKRVVEELFEAHGQAYSETTDAPFILSHARYEDIAARYPQCFKPFVDFLSAL